MFCFKYIVTSPVEHVQYSSWRLQVDCESSVAYMVHEGTLPGDVWGMSMLPLTQPASETRDGVVTRKAHAFFVRGLFNFSRFIVFVFTGATAVEVSPLRFCGSSLAELHTNNKSKTEFRGATKVITD